MSKKLLIGIIIIAIAVVIIGGYLLLTAKMHKVYRVGIVSGLDPFISTADGFKEKMAELGYKEGENIIYDLQKTNANPAEEERIVKKFVADKVDLIFSFPTSASVAAKAATQGTDISVVFANAIVEGTNLIDNVRQPGGNITGVRFPAFETTVKRLEFLHDLVPQAKRIYIPYDPNYPGISFTLEELHKAVPAMNIILIEAPVTDLEQLKDDLEARGALSNIGMDAILIMPTLLTAGPNGFELINKFAAEHELAVGGSTGNNADMGAVFSYIPDNIEFGKLAAMSADKVLRGIPAGTIPVITPEAYLRLNYKVAQSLGLTVPESLLIRANEVIR